MKKKKNVLIEPLADVVPTSQPAPMTQSPVTIPQTISPPSLPAQTKHPISRPPATTSLKNLVETENRKELAVQPEKEEVLNHPFTQEDLVRQWDAFLKITDTKVHLKNTMINCKPVLQENSIFEVGVHNPAPKEELEASGTEILSFLRANLKNTKIQMRVRILESNTKRLAYTTSEKYDHLLNENPLLSKLREEFNLQAE